MAHLFDKAKGQFSNIQGQFSAIQGTVTDTLLAAKNDVEANAGKIQGTFKDLLTTAPQVIDTTTQDFNDVQETAGKIQGQFSNLLNTTDNTTRDLAGFLREVDIKDQTEASASSTAETAKTETNSIAAFFAGILEKCCAPFNKKKD